MMTAFDKIWHSFLLLRKNILACGGYKNLDEELYIASWHGDVSEVCRLLQKGVSTKYVNYRGETPLMRAAWLGHVKVVREIIGAGADLEAQDDFENTALKSAAVTGHVDVVKELMAAGANLETSDSLGRTVLICATINEQAAVVRELLNAFADTEAASSAPPKWTALFYAAELGNADIVRFLLDGGADFEAKDGDGANPMYYAARAGFVDVMQELISVGTSLEHDNPKELSDIRANIASFKAEREGWEEMRV